MPWVDIVIVLLIIGAALIGYNVGLLGAFKGFIGSIAGLFAAWLLTPLAQAWLEGVWGLETKLAAILLNKLPESLRALLLGAGQAARTLQELKASLLELPLPPEMALYLQRALEKTPADMAVSPDLLAGAMAREIAGGLLWAGLFFALWLIVAFLVRGFLGMLFVNRDGKTIVGMFDGILGTVVMSVLAAAVLVVVCGLSYPFILLGEPGESGMARLYPYLLDSKLIGWLAGTYQLYIVPWIG